MIAHDSSNPARQIRTKHISWGAHCRQAILLGTTSRAEALVVAFASSVFNCLNV